MKCIFLNTLLQLYLQLLCCILYCCQNQITEKVINSPSNVIEMWSNSNLSLLHISYLFHLCHIRGFILIFCCFFLQHHTDKKSISFTNLLERISEVWYAPPTNVHWHPVQCHLRYQIGRFYRWSIDRDGYYLLLDLPSWTIYHWNTKEQD